MVPVVAKALSLCGKVVGKYALDAAQSTKASRWALAAYQRGRGPFGIPSGRALILTPAKINTREASKVDQAGAEDLARMYRELGYLEKTEWERRDIASPVDATDITRNLYVLCGANPMAHGLIRSDRFLKTISMRYAQEPEERRLRWHCHDYYWSDGLDYAILAVRPNPHNPKSRIVILSGLRSPGTEGACQVFAKPEFAALRKQIEKEYASKDGSLEVVLEVEHSGAGDAHKVETIRVAEPMRRRVGTEELELPIRVDARALERIYDSLDVHPRSVVLSEYRYQITYTRDYSLRIVVEGTWAADQDEVVNWGRSIGCDKPVKDIGQLELSTTQIKPDPVLSGHDIASVLVSNRADERKFINFPLPPIARGEPGRRYRSSVLWPDGGYKLREEDNRDLQTIVVPINSKTPVNSCTIEFAFELGGRFGVEPKFHTGDPSIAADTFTQGHPCEFRTTDVPPGTVLKFAVFRKPEVKPKYIS
jgi:hypothetical protein